MSSFRCGHLKKSTFFHFVIHIKSRSFRVPLYSVCVCPYRSFAFFAGLEARGHHVSAPDRLNLFQNAEFRFRKQLSEAKKWKYHVKKNKQWEGKFSNWKKALLFISFILLFCDESEERKMKKTRFLVFSGICGAVSVSSFWHKYSWGQK